MGIMLVYDITNEKSFENIVKWLRNIDEVSIVYEKTSIYNILTKNSCSLFLSLCAQHANEDVEKMILANKCDMADKRVVNKERGEAVSEQNEK